MKLPKPRLSWVDHAPLFLVTAAARWQAQRAVFAGVDKLQDFRDRRVLARHRLHRTQPLGKDAALVKQLLVKRANGRKAFTGKFAAPHTDDVEALQARILTVHQAVRNHVAPNAANAADHDLRPDTRELMNGGQTADKDKIADLAVSAERCRSCENDVVADLTVMSDMTAIHEVTAVADASSATAADCSDIHRDGFPDGTAFPDFEFGRLAAIVQGLRRATQRGERIDRAAGADGRVTRHMDMRDQLGVRADDDVTADHAIRPDRRAFADHSAVFKARGWIDRGHRRSTSLLSGFGANRPVFQWLARGAGTVQ